LTIRNCVLKVDGASAGCWWAIVVVYRRRGAFDRLTRRPREGRVDPFAGIYAAAGVSRANPPSLTLVRANAAHELLFEQRTWV
jgi:hypothetical protein